MAKLKVEVVVGLVDRLTGPLKGLQGRVKSIGQNMQRTGIAMTGVGAGIAAAFAPAIRAFSDVEDAATRMELATMRAGGITPQLFSDLDALANDLGDRLPGTTADFTRMLTMLQRQGMAAETVLAGTGEAAANLAVMLQMVPESAAEFTAKLQDATSTSAEDMMSLADTIQRTYYVGVDPSSMLGAYSSLAPAMDIIGKRGIEGAREMAPLIALLDQAKLSGESAGNALRKVFTRSFAQGKDAPGAMKKSGMSLIDKSGNFKGLDNMLREVQKLKKFSPEERLQIIGDIWGDDSETLQALNTMINKGTEGYAEMVAKMREQASLQERIDKLLGTLLNLWDAASGTFTNLMAAIGKLLGPEIKEITKWFGNVSAAVKLWIKDNPALAKTIAMVAVGITGLLLVLGSLGVVVGTTMWALAPLVGVLVFIISPVVAAIAAVAALVVAIANWEATVALAGQAWEWLIERIRPLAVVFAVLVWPVALVIYAINSLIVAIANLIAGLINWEETAAIAGQTWEWLLDKIRLDPTPEAVARWAALSTYLHLWAANLPQIFANAVEALKSVGRNLIDGLWAGIQERWAALSQKVAGIARSITGIFRAETDTHSPSRVFEAIGLDLMRGLAIGIDRTAGMPMAAVGRAAAGVVAGSALAFGSAGPVAASPAIHMPITITIQAPAGMDARALAALVRQQVEAATQQASRGIAALYDRGDGL